MKSFWTPKAKPKYAVKLGKYPKRSMRENKLIAKHPYKDSDHDKVMNYFDCKPLVRKKQDYMKNQPTMPSGIAQPPTMPMQPKNPMPNNPMPHNPMPMPHIPMPPVIKQPIPAMPKGGDINKIPTNPKLPSMPNMPTMPKLPGMQPPSKPGYPQFPKEGPKILPLPKPGDMPKAIPYKAQPLPITPDTKYKVQPQPMNKPPVEVRIIDGVKYYVSGNKVAPVNRRDIRVR